jgi:excisionase family DNA binding protein
MTGALTPLPDDGSAAFLTLAEACRVLGIDPSWGRKLLASGEFPVPTVKIGRRQKIARYQLEKLATGGEAA